MPLSFHSTVARGLTCAGVLALAAPGVFGQARSAPPLEVTAGETVDVEVKIVSFYAVDAQGRPVTDLRREEIELRVGGAPVRIESFDRYVIGERSGAPASRTAIPSRNVYFLFDTVFSSVSGFNRDKRLAARMLESWPAGDRLSLIVNGTRAGLERKLGPVSPDGPGKKALLVAVEGLLPEVRRVGLQDNPESDFGPNGERASRGNNFGVSIPEEQVHAAWDGLQGSARGEYIGVARSFASSLEAFAAELRRTPGPKLVVIFSQGMDDTLYFNGDSGNAVGSDDTIRVNTRRAGALVDQFRKPLAALAESGAMPMFVNTDQSSEIDADAPLRDMAKTSGGLYFGGNDPGELQGRVAGSTAAYYEAGFHPAGAMRAAARAGVEIAVRRPGVRAWASPSVRMWEPYRSLSAAERRRLVIDLVAGGPEAQRAHSAVRLKLQELGGRVVGEAASGRRRLKFEAAWPESLANRKLDLYNVMLASPEGGRKGKVLAFDQREGAAGADRDGLEATLEGKGPQVWGILAVDPETEQAWVRRLMLRPPGNGRGSRP